MHGGFEPPTGIVVQQVTWTALICAEDSPPYKRSVSNLRDSEGQQVGPELTTKCVSAERGLSGNKKGLPEYSPLFLLGKRLF